MRYADGTYDLTVDDTQEIQVETSKKFEKMTKQEIIDFLVMKVKKCLKEWRSAILFYLIYHYKDIKLIN